MAFKLDDLIIDRIQYGVAEDFSGNLLYTLTQLNNATINITATSRDINDARGTLVKRFWDGKTGEFTATNAMLNLNVLGEASGEGKQLATQESPITMPKIITVAANTTATLSNFVTGTVKVYGLGTNGTMLDEYTVSSGNADETHYGLTSAGVLTPPTDSQVSQYIVKYNRTVSSGVMIANNADKFPRTVKLTLKALAVDPCSADTLQAIYIVLPSFQVSPEVEINIGSDTQELNYNGALQVDYCSTNKALYYIYVAEDDAEE